MKNAHCKTIIHCKTIAGYLTSQLYALRIGIGLLLVTLIACCIGYFSTESAFKPAYARAGHAATVNPSSVPKRAPLPQDGQEPQRQGAAKPPFVEIIPDQNGTAIEIFSAAETMGNTGVFINLDSTQLTQDGPSHIKGSYTTTYSDTAKLNTSTVIGFAPKAGIDGVVNVTTTLGVDTSQLKFNRTFLQSNASNGRFQSADGLLQVLAPNPETLSFDTYVAVTDNLTPPGPPPPGWRLISKSYSLRAPKTVLTTQKSLILKLFYQPDQIGDINPRTLTIAAWNGTTKRWDAKLGSQLVDRSRREPPHVQLGEVQEFTVYALMATTTWHDDFVDLDGLEKAQTQNMAITFTERGPVLALAPTADNGSAVSLPITAPYDIKNWAQLTFNAESLAPTTTLTVDVLDQAGMLLLENVPNRSSLAAIDAAAHPILRLRVNMSATVADTTPLLTSWRVRWQVQQPVTLGAGTQNQVQIGDVITIPLTLRNDLAQTIGGVAATLHYDPLLLEAQACTLASARAAAFCNSSYEADQIPPDSVRFTLLLNQVITGEVPLGAIQFVVKGRAAEPTALTIVDPLVADPAGTPLLTLTQAGAVQFAPGLAGDVNCDDVVNSSDADYILEFDAGLRQAGTSCPLPPATLFLAQCDLNGDGLCNVVDALKLVAP